MTYASAQELNGYLARGLGRAHVVLEHGADASQREALVAACLRDDALPLEGSRAAYLIELVLLVGATDDLAAVLADPLADLPGDDDIAQRYELAGLLARDGVPGMREVLYRGQEQLIDRWLAEPTEWGPSTVPARHLIAIDGIGGAIFAFAQLGRAALAGGSFGTDQELIDAAHDALGGERADAMLAEARANDPRVDAYLLAAETPPTRDDNPLPEGWLEWPWVELKEAIERRVRGTGLPAFFASRWGERAPEGELSLAAQAFVGLPNDDVELLRSYLRIFKKRPFPLDPAPLVALIDDPRRSVATLAIEALERISHTAVRAIALQMADRGPHRESALGLLARNWHPGDELIAERLLRAAAGDEEGLHTLGYGLRDVIEAHPSSLELVPALRLAYELQPCSRCRTHVVAALLRLAALPDAVRAECRWDANEETRQLVSSEA